MGNNFIPRESQSDAADKYREDLGLQLVCCAHDDCDYDIDGVHIDFLDYVSLLQDEWVRVNCESEKDSIGSCSRCKDGLMTDADHNYGITCRIDSVVHHQWDSCEYYVEEI